MLAAGASRRAGSINKLLHPARIGVDAPVPMVRATVARAVAAGVGQVRVVTGHAALEVGAALAGLPVRTAHNPDAASGMASSLACGLAALVADEPADGPRVEAALVCLGDMPLVRPATLVALADAWRARPELRAVVPVHRGRRGNPVLLARSLFDGALALDGDVGARTLLRGSGVRELDVDDPGILVDHDTPEALASLDRAPHTRAPRHASAPVSPPDADILRTLVAWRRAGHAVQLVTVASTWGSSPRPPGSIAVVRDDGAVAGSVSGGCIERRLAQSRGTEARTPGGGAAVGVEALHVGDDDARRVGLTCGGRLELVFEEIDDPSPFEAVLAALEARRRTVRTVDVDARRATLADAGPADAFAWDGRTLRRPFGPGWRVLLVGAGELSKHVARFALALDFEVIVCEPRAPFRSDFDVAGVALVDELPDDAVAAHAVDARSAVLTLAHEPTLDDLALEEALRAACFHVGALGSRRSHAKRVERLSAQGATPGALARISAPVGLDIGSRTAAEIGVSIAAELVQARARAMRGAAAGPREAEA